MKINSSVYRGYLPLVIVGGLFASAALYFYQGGHGRLSGAESETAALADASVPDRFGTGLSAANPYRPTRPVVEDAPTHAGIADAAMPFEAGEIQRRLQEFFARVNANPPPSRAEQDAFAARLLAAVDGSAEARQAVAEAYRAMPASQAMERDMLRGMLVPSPQGRALVLDEANQIWASKDKGLYGEMYETYSNLPGQATREVYADALATLDARDTDQRTAVAALNFIGTIENDVAPGADALKRSAVAQMDSLASGNGDALVRAMAVQKIYRLSAPDAAADVAVNYIARGATSPLVMTTLDAVASGDVQLSPTLRSTLASAVARPSASSAERQRFGQVVGAGQ
ncbi:hypothetical protein [Xanthomonas sp. SI]|uniref:hypothetical protein n=1 Tax=Xanthomonas sp. SI TaxID=2724123 RepID=UPI0018601BA4|nr:hypothetical protein [Xanthomonas sp. SI]QNH12791.1 hypothetical protein HEP75_02233 [Xanthomonas sp. SI]